MGERGPGAGGGDGLGEPVAEPLEGLNFSELHFEAHSGPLPHPATLLGYEQIQDGLADRIVTMAERAQAARIEADLAPIRAEAWALKVATVAVSFFPWLGIGIAALLVTTGNPAAAGIAAALGMGAAGPQIIAATRRPRAQPAQPPAQPRKHKA